MLVGAIQGFIFAGTVLFSKKHRSRSNFFLAALIFTVSYNLLQYYLVSTNIVGIDNIFKTFYLPIASINPVLLYLYVLLFLNPKKQINGLRKLLFIPFILFFIAIIAYKLANAFDLGSQAFYDFYGPLYNFHEAFSFLFTCVMLLICFKVIADFRRKNKASNYKVIKPKINWLIILLVLLLINLIIYGYLLYQLFTAQDQFISFYPLWIANAVIIYIMGHIGLYKFGILQQRKKIRSFASTSAPYSIVEQTQNQNILKLQNLLIEEKRFADPLLSLESIASEIGISKTHLSRTVNAELNKTFTDYVNGLRIEEAKRYLMNKEFANYTILAIGMEAGFNSKTTFNLAFKKFTGQTPSQFRNSRDL